MRPESFLKGAIVLTIAGIIVKILGAVYRIPFTRMVGSEGVGLYQMAYPIYLMLIALSTTGVPVAISLLVAEKAGLGDRTGMRKVFLFSLLLLFVWGVALSFGLFRSAPYLATNVLGDARAYYPLVCMAPAILVNSVASVLRGYFQGCRMMWPTALSEVIEQIFRVATVFWAAYMLLPRGVEFAAAGAAFGAFTGACGSLLVLWCIFLWLERSQVVKWSALKKWARLELSEICDILKRLMAYALPVSTGSLVIPLVQVIDAVIIPNRLQAGGCTASNATSLFGQLSGMAGTLVFLPAVFTVSLASSLVPHIAAAHARGNRDEIRKRIETSVRMTVILCLPATAGIAVLATPFMDILFDDPAAGPVTAWLAPAAFFSGLQQVTTGALQGLGNTWLPVINLLVGCVVKVLCNYYLTVLPFFGVKGAALGSIFGFLTAAMLNFLALRVLFKYSCPFFCLPRPVLAATIMGVVLPGIYSFFSFAGDTVAAGGAVIGGAAVYFAVLIMTKEIRICNLRHFIRR